LAEDESRLLTKIWTKIG